MLDSDPILIGKPHREVPSVLLGREALRFVLRAGVVRRERESARRKNGVSINC